MSTRFTVSILSAVAYNGDYTETDREYTSLDAALADYDSVKLSAADDVFTVELWRGYCDSVIARKSLEPEIWEAGTFDHRDAIA